MEPWFTIYLTCVGAAVGSFLNVCIYRWPEGLSVVRPRSRCPVCENPIAWYDNVPVLSWLVLRGRCRHCGTRISFQYPLVELVTALMWLGMALWHGPSWEAVRGGLFLSLLLGIAVLDARHRIIPDQLSVLGALAGLGFALAPAGVTFRTAIIGAAVGYAFMWLVKLGGEAAFRKPALGVGDIHMMAMVGAFVGLSGAILTIMLGSVFGLLIGVPLMSLKGRLRFLGTYLPLGTFLALGAAVAYIWGPAIIGWYLALVLTA
ncbi:MAG TPA: prepilin peptidase [Longimicrobiales bacterium]|nr:prepilin peptidase [Longimicrobiales bacterium]